MEENVYFTDQHNEMTWLTAIWQKTNVRTDRRSDI